MTMVDSQKPKPGQYFLNQLKEGNEQGLEHFYRIWYPKLSWWALKRVKDDVAASSIAHEAFLRLWLLRENFNDATQLTSFLEKQIRNGCNNFYQKTSTRFQRTMLRLDDIENYQEFIGGYNPEHTMDDVDTLCQEEFDQEKQAQWATVEKSLPNLSKDQQLFIRLCLRYSFNYERIAWHLGGISDYEVGLKIEKSILCLKNIIVNIAKLDVVTKARSFSFEGGISEEQARILNMRYEMQYSFAEIAAELSLSQMQVQSMFVQAHAVLKKGNKGTAKV